MTPNHSPRPASHAHERTASADLADADADAAADLADPTRPPRRAPSTTDAVIAERAAQQHGVVARGQLLAAGITPRMIQRRLESGVLVPVHLGVYRLGSLRGPLRPRRAAEMAAVLASGPDAVVSHRSMGRMWGVLPPWPGAGATVDISIPGHRRRARSGIRIHRRSDLGPSDVTTVEGIPGTTPIRTLGDLSTVLSVRELDRAIARAQDLGLVRSDQLATLLDGPPPRSERPDRPGRPGHAPDPRHPGPRAHPGQRGRPGAPALRAVMGAGGPTLTRSEAEERLLDLVRAGGLPEPEVNVVVAGYEVDVLWRRERLAVEVDGYRFHRSRRSFERDRRRDARLTAAAGITVVRVTWRQLTCEPTATVVRLAQALARVDARRWSGTPRRAPDDPARTDEAPPGQRPGGASFIQCARQDSNL